MFSGLTRGLIFQPPKRVKYTDERSFFVDIKVRSSVDPSITICGIHIKSNSNKYVVWSMGNACDCLTMNAYLTLFSKLHNVNVIAYDYPGYGMSTGSPSEQGCYDALDHVMVYLTHTLYVPTTDIVLVGYSLGTGVVAEYISTHVWSSKVYLIAPYKSIARVVYDASWSLWRWLFDSFVTIDKLYKTSCEIQLVHGSKDQVIPISHSYDLKKTFFGPEVKVYEADHSSILEHDWFEM